ncbi:MAG TPA: hypothetical protein VIQ54_12410 [Polyangia bacterium]|jgi:hypothetical protein
MGGGAKAPPLLGGLLAASICACAATMYAGPKRPDSETMLVESTGLNVVRIDDAEPPSASKFRLLPGPHRVEVALADWNAGPGIRRSDVTELACFTGRPGHSYLVRPLYYEGRRWRPQIVDENVTSAIASNDCSSRGNREDGDATAPYERKPVPIIVPVLVPR